MNIEDPPQPPADTRGQLRDVLIIVAVGLLALLPFLGQTHDLASREVRHAQIAREMAQSGDFLAPTLLGKLYADKPPVMHAAVAMLYRLAGEHSMGLARLPSALAAILAALVLYAIAVAMDGRRTALLAALGMLGVLGFAKMGREARPDMIFTAGILVSCLGFVRGMRGDAARRWLWFALAGFGCGVATVSKGPLGLAFPLLFAVLAPIRRTDWRWPRPAGWTVFVLALLATAAIWVVPVYLRDHGAYLHRVIFQPDLDVDADTGTHPFYWYLPQVVLGLLPLTLLLPLVVMDVRRRGYTAAVAVAVAMFVLLSCIGKKRVHYLLPVYPFLALAVAEAVLRFADRRWVLRLTQTLIALALAAAPVYHGWIAPKLQHGEDPQFVFARKVLAAAKPGATIVCYGTMAEPIAFLARANPVAECHDAATTEQALRNAVAGSCLVVPDEQRDAVIDVFSKKFALTELLSDQVPAGRKVRGWRVYRIDVRPPAER